MAITMFQNLFMLLGWFSLTISALTIGNSRAVASQTYGISPQISTPEPTKAPRLEELRRRQESQRTLLAAPDNTCGYFGGNSVSPWGCSTGNCVFATPTAIANSTQTAGSVLCCDPSTGCPSAPAPTACVDKGRYDYSTACTGTCSKDPMTLKCTSGIYLFCNTLTFPTPAISAYFCNYLSTYDVYTVSTTFAGQAGHSFTPTVAKFAVSTSASSTISSSSSSGAAKSLSSTKSSSTASATSSLGNEGSAKKTVNKRALVGGIVGGVVGLALIVGAVLLFLKWRNTPSEENEKPVDPVSDKVGNSVTVRPAN